MIGELEPLINQTDIELSLLKISENGKNKFFTVLEGPIPKIRENVH